MKSLNEIAEFVKNILHTEGADMAQFCVSTSETQEFNADGGNLSLLRTMYDNSLVITAYKNHKKGSVVINNFEESAIREAIANCLRSAESGIADEAYAIAPKQENRYFEEGAYTADLDRFFSRSMELIDTIRNDYPKILITMMILMHKKTHALYCDTNGTEYETRVGNYAVEICFAGHEKDTTTSMSETHFSTASLDEPFITLGSLAKDLQDAQDQLHTVPFSGKLDGTIILTPSCLCDFFRSICRNFAGDGVILEKTSLWLDKLQKKVADERLTVSIAPLDSRIVCGERYTEDGFPSENYDLIHKGILQSFMLSLYVSNKSGFQRAANSSASLIVEGGDTPYEDMVKSIKKGLIVGSFSGGEPSTNGDFSGVAKNSFLIEDGKIVGAVNEVMINGNLAELLNNIHAISKETIAEGSYVLPYISFDHVIISGK